MNNKYFNKRKISFKNLINSIIFLFSIISLSFFYLFFYSLIKSQDQVKKDPGFAQATPVKQNDLCNKFSRSEDCSKNLVNDLKKNKKNILFLGNSQTGAINNYQEGDETYFAIIKSSFDYDKDLNIKGIWLPNANFKEFENIHEQLTQCKLEIKTLFLPAFLDDTRSDEIRESLNRDKFCSNLKENSTEPNEDNGNLKILNSKIKENIFFFNSLQNINQDLRVDLYKMRNSIFNIKPQTIRKIRYSSYKNNIISLNNIINQRNKLNLNTIIYIPPLLNANGNGPIPYSAEEYKNFKSDIKDICKKTIKCSYHNLENLVPNSLWGMKDSTTFTNTNKELDFMHFTYEGHKLLAKKLSSILSNLNKS